MKAKDGDSKGPWGKTLNSARSHSEMPLALGKLRKRSSEDKSENSFSQSQIKLLKERLENTQYLKDTYEKSLKQKSKRIKQLEKLLEDCDCSCKIKTIKIDKLQDTISQMTQKLKSQNQAFEELETQYKTLETKLTQENQKTKLELQESSSKNQELIRNLIFLEENNQQLRSELKDNKTLEDTLQRNNQSIVNLERKLSYLKQDYDQVVKQNKFLKSLVENKESSTLAQLENRLLSSEMKIQELQSTSKKRPKKSRSSRASPLHSKYRQAFK